MANIQERRNKSGELISFSIRVHRGRDSSGKQLKPFSTTFEVPEGWTEARAIKEASKQAIIYERQCKEGTAPDSKQNFAQYADYVLKLKERAGVKKSTLNRYDALIGRIKDGIGHIKISDIRPQHLNLLYEELSKDGLNKRTGGKLSGGVIKQHHSLISAILGQAEKEMLIPYNPAEKATSPKKERANVKPYQVEEVDRIVDCLNEQPIKWKLFTYLLLITGCRKGEILGLTWDDVDYVKKQIRVTNNLQYTPKDGLYLDTTKSGKSRMIKLPDEVMQLFTQYKAYYAEQKLKNGDRWQSDPKWKDSKLIFVQEEGNPGNPMHPASINHWLNDFTKENGLPHLNPHAFRHTYASILISKGIDIVTVSKSLGHEKVSTTVDVYAELMKQANEEASKCISDVVLKRAK